MLLLRRVEVPVDLGGGVRRRGVPHGAFGQRMHGHALSGGDARDVEEQSGAAVADQEFALFGEGLHLPEQGGVPRFAGVLREDRHGVAAGEHQRTELPFAAFQLGDRGVRREPDARIGPDFPAAGDGEQG